MVYAAWFELYTDDVVVAHPTALRVYARLLKEPKIFTEPWDAKAWAIAQEIGIHPNSAQGALTLLIDRGFVIEHGRGMHNVRRVTVALKRAPADAPTT